MSSFLVHTPRTWPDKDDITTRRRPPPKENNMVTSLKLGNDLGGGDCSLIESILSKDETKDILSMMIMADELEEDSCLHSFCTSTQMGGRVPRYPPTTPQLSPLGQQGHRRCVGTPQPGFPTSTENGANPQVNHDCGIPLNEQDMNTRNLSTESLLIDNETNEMTMTGGQYVTEVDRSVVMSRGSVTELRRPDDPYFDYVVDVSNSAVRPDTTTMTTTAVKETGDELADLEDKNLEGADGDTGGGVPQPSIGEKKPQDPADRSAANGDVVNCSPPATSDLSAVTSKLNVVEEILLRLDSKTTKFEDTVNDLRTSLEYSQHEIDLLKKENSKLKHQLNNIDTEDKRTQFQMRAMEDKLDRLETVTKKKNLVIEGIKEVEGRKEDLEKTIGDVFDQLAIHGAVNFEACYRVGAHNKNRTRPIMISFEKQSDRDMVYAKRLDLKNTRSYGRVWINEDLGPLSKRKRGLIRLISKEAQLQGIDCRTGKYAIHIDRQKFDRDNLDDLPPPLHPTNLKQVQLDEHTIAYQSEFAPFSNFYPCPISIGKQPFFCLEQAYQFLHAKILNKPLLATKIFLSRDVRYIKQMGAEMGTSEEWDNRKFDVMYECLKKKFDQNPDLKALLLKTGDLELIEATPDRLWGCGATLSSNAIRKRNWPGQNKHGHILMTIREEYR